ncbi:hypothetical protein F0562_010057 [Nyssa sinensis]|uniref:Uncharacterized protein n=1 Tax=Nyssa sinensis TaxID=561372 RepID=A0A5J5A0E9_9ASTE|nr:hypothetical protein F0562_010057 [Nyssa sinensis]
MEGVGSRLGRASARYGPATVFTGPVRKWKKQWVHVSSSSSNASYQNTSQANGNGNSNGSTLLLCRWTPISQTNNGNPDYNSGKPEPPRRKFRYTPIVVLEEAEKRGG